MRKGRFNLKISHNTKFEIVVISIITACYLVAGVLLFVLCNKTDHSDFMSYAILSFSFIVAIYAFITLNNKRKKK